MREISVFDHPKLKAEYESAQVNRAMEKISEALKELSRLNVDAIHALSMALKDQPKTQSTDLTPLIEAIIKARPEAVPYTFVIERNSANMISKVRALPDVN